MKKYIVIFVLTSMFFSSCIVVGGRSNWGWNRYGYGGWHRNWGWHHYGGWHNHMGGYGHRR